MDVGVGVGGDDNSIQLKVGFIIIWDGLLDIIDSRTKREEEPGDEMREAPHGFTDGARGSIRSRAVNFTGVSGDIPYLKLQSGACSPYYGEIKAQREMTVRCRCAIKPASSHMSGC